MKEQGRSAPGAGNATLHYGMYILSMLIFGTNGLLVAHISHEARAHLLPRALP